MAPGMPAVVLPGCTVPTFCLPGGVGDVAGADRGGAATCAGFGGGGVKPDVYGPAHWPLADPD